MVILEYIENVKLDWKKAIAELKQEIHEHKNTISRLRSESRALSESINERDSSIHKLKDNIQDQKDKENKLNQDLQKAVSREKGSRKEGYLLAELTSAVANLSGLSSKLQLLRENFSDEHVLPRAILYSIESDQRLRFLAGQWHDREMDALQSQTVLLSETAFGQAMATLRPRTITGDKNDPHPDLPGGLRQLWQAHLNSTNQIADKQDNNANNQIKQLANYLLIPLTEEQQLNGLLILGTDHANDFNEVRMRLAEYIAPLIAVALKHEINRESVHRLGARLDDAEAVVGYLQNQMMRLSNHLHSVAQRSLRDITAYRKKHGLDTYPLDEDLVSELRRLSEDPVLRDQDLRNTSEGLKNWIDELGGRAVALLGLEYESRIPEEDLEFLVESIGPPVRNFFELLREAVSNVIQHSRAGHLIIFLTRNDNTFEFTIEDNGEGLVRTSGQTEPERGTGLKAIQHLAHSMGATCEFTRDARGYGHVIRLIWKV